MSTNTIQELPAPMPPPPPPHPLVNGTEVGAVEVEHVDHPFWSESTILTHVLRYARYKAVSPYATLAAVLRRAVGNVPPHVVLPATVGSVVSLNLFTFSVADSGGGKDAANGAGADAVVFYDFHADVSCISQLAEPVDAPPMHPGTGEGLARHFKGHPKAAKKKKDDEDDEDDDEDDDGPQTKGHLQVPDVATLEALSGRNGATLVGQLLAAWMGQPLGFSNNSEGSSTKLPAHSYRLVLGVGIQPDNGEFLTSRVKDGFPQRFWLVPTSDSGAPWETPEPVAPLPLEVPDFGSPEDGQVVLSIPGAVSDEIRRHRVRVLRKDPTVDQLDGHVKLSKLKVAAALAILHGRKEVTQQDWDWAGHLIDDVSAQLRQELVDHVEAMHQSKRVADAVGKADAAMAAGDFVAAKKYANLRGAIQKHLKNGPATKAELRRTCRRQRDEFDSGGFEEMLDDGFIVCYGKGGDGKPDRYRLG